jgi:hypothetical protein
MDKNKAMIRGFFDDVLNQGDIDGAGRFVCEDVVEQVPFPGQGPGLQGVKDALRWFRSAWRRWVG